MNIFQLINNNVVVSAEVLTIPHFNKIWKADKSKDKNDAYKQFTYIYHKSDYNSPYSNFPEDKKEEMIKADILGDKNFNPSNEVIEAVEKYKQLQETPLQRLLQAVKNKVDDIATYLEGTSIDDDNIKTIMDAFGKISTTVSNFDKLQQAVEKEKEQSNTRIRGDKQVNSDYNE